MSDLFPRLLSENSDGALIALSLLPKAVLILAAAWLLERGFRRGSAAVRHGIWVVALVGLVSLPSAALWLPALTLELPDILAAVESAAPAGPAAVVTQAAVPLQNAPAETVLGAAQVRDPAPGVPPVEIPGEQRGVDWAGAFLLLWAAGAALRLFWLAVQLVRVRRLSGSARPGAGGAVVQLTEELRHRLGIRRRVQVLESSRASMPLTWGVLRPIILLPEDVSGWPEGRLRVVLLHELAHIRRWDYLTYLLAEIACVVYWPVPLVWLARARVQLEQERACDDLVLASGTASLEYAEHLLAVARAFYGNRWELGVSVSMAREISLKHRIRTILDDQTNRGPLLSGSGLLVLLLLFGVALPVAAVRPGSTAVEPHDGRLGKGGSSTDGELPAPASMQPVSPQEEAALAPVLLWLEAEEGATQLPMELREDLDASAGAFMVVPDGAGNDAPEGGSGQVRFSFEVPQTGEYLIWGRVIGDHGNDNSLYVSVDGGREVRWDIEDGKGKLLREWSWIPLRDRAMERDRPEPLRFPLSAGAHTLQIRNREDGTRLDRLLITADPDYVPSGRGAAASGFRPIYQWMEVERARLEGPLERGGDERASGGHYISFQQGRAAVGGGSATFALDVPVPGRYVVWGRVLAPDAGANSFHVSVDGREEVVWDAPQREPGSRAGWWSWSPLSAREYNGRRVDPLLLDLQPGRHVLRIRTREAGTRLDGILVTNDLAFRPRGMWPTDPPTRPARVWLEAESARLEAPLLVRGDSTAAGGLYVEAEKESTRWEVPDAESPGSATLRFRVPRAGLYNFWARTLVRHDGEDSFWVRLNGGRWIRWNAIPQSRSWNWSMIHDADREREVAQFQLEGGENILEIAPREGGARLDRLLVTDDPLYEPDAPTDR